MQFINFEEQTPPKEFKLRDIDKMFNKAPQCNPKGDPRGKEVNLSNVETIEQTQEERVKDFLVKRSFSDKIHNGMLIEALLRKRCSHHNM